MTNRGCLDSRADHDSETPQPGVSLRTPGDGLGEAESEIVEDAKVPYADLTDVDRLLEEKRCVGIRFHT